MTQKPDLLVVNNFHEETLDLLDKHYTTHHLWKLDDTNQRRLIASLEGKCRAAATASWNCDPQIYDLQSLELIAAFGVGVDGIDFLKTNAQGIHVSNTPDVLNDAVADLALALILATTRNLIKADQFARDGNWESGPFAFGYGLAGKTLGIAGLGRIGEAIAERAAPFKLNIAYHNRSKKPLPYTYYPDLLSLADNSDILLNMLPGGQGTENIIDARVFAAIGADGYFINVGRGSSVDEEALIYALQSGVIAGAGLDVYKNEPSLPKELADLQNTVLLPHIGSATVETRRAMGRLVFDNLSAFFAGKPLLTEVSQPL
jgi:lactate dehydrogenase-like 2-hydroxyacid dehydrogenase